MFITIKSQLQTNVLFASIEEEEITSRTQRDELEHGGDPRAGCQHDDARKALNPGHIQRYPYGEVTVRVQEKQPSSLPDRTRSSDRKKGTQKNNKAPFLLCMPKLICASMDEEQTRE